MPDTGAEIISGRRTRREPLSVRRITRAALELLDSGGLAAVTMRAVANLLDVEAMSLYRYVVNRDRMLDNVIELIVDELADAPEVELEPSGPWRDWLAPMARGVRRFSRAHPRAFPLIATHPSDVPWLNPPLRSARWVEALLHGLTEQGFSDDEALYAYRIFNTFLLGFLLLETSAMTSAQRSASTDPAEVAEEYPTIARLADELAADRWDREFEDGLTAMLERIGRFREESVTNSDAAVTH
jgi:TetR/AcrR family tetracycline transcriptional repressor